MDKPLRDVYAIALTKNKKIWTQIGLAFENRDGSINVKLRCMPIDGQMQLRVREPRAPEHTATDA